MSIIHSSKVDDLYYAGQYDKAVEEANKSKAWAIWALIVGLIAPNRILWLEINALAALLGSAVSA